MRITTSAASCRSTFMRPVRASPSPSSCAKAGPQADPKSVPSSSTPFGIFAAIGPRPASAGAATAMPAPKQWIGARRTASITSSGSPGTMSSMPRSASSPTISACAEPRADKRSVDPGPSSATPPKAGPAAPRRGSSWCPTRGFDARHIVTTLEGSAEHLYETVYCARGQAENFIKLHKTQLASDRTSCRSPRANQFRLILHTAAYWLLHTLRAAAPKRSGWKTAEFTTLRLLLDRRLRAASSKAPRASAYGCRRHAPTPRSSDCWQADSPLPGREPWGVVAPPSPSRNPQPPHNQDRHKRRTKRNPSARSHS